tara:strand:- start:5169 stop:7526 length:2358 start_codon:yes stop_codon:yes gene_type:complete
MPPSFLGKSNTFFINIRKSFYTGERESMPNSNLVNAKNNMKTRIRNRVSGSNPRDLGRLAKSARFVGLTDDSEVETDIDTEMAAVIPSASVDDLVEMSEGLKELRTGAADMGTVANADSLTEGGNKFLNAESVQPSISVSGDLSYNGGVVSYTAPTASALQVVATVGDLPAGASAGDQAVVQSNNKLYIKTADGWYAVALINTAPSISGNSATYELATDMTPTVITLTATDPENDPVTFSYAVTSGDLNGTTVQQADNVFTVSPHGLNDATFELTFSANDTVNVATSVSSFSLTHGIDWSNPTQIAVRGWWGVNIYESHGLNVSSNQNQWPGGSEQTAVASYFKNGKSWVVAGDSKVTDGSTDGLIYGLALHPAAGLQEEYGGDWENAHWSYQNPNPYSASYGQPDYYGQKVDVSPNATWVITGAENENPPQDFGRQAAGMAYLYNLDTDSYVTINDPNISHMGNWGEAVAVNDTHCAVGKTDYDSKSGKVGIFENATGNLVTWVYHTGTHYQDTRWPTDSWHTTEANGYFGSHIVMNNEYMCVSASNEQPANGHNQIGAVYVYDMTNPASPAFLYKLENPDYSGANVPTSVIGNSPYQMNHRVHFGGDSTNPMRASSIQISGTKLAVGAPGNYTADSLSGTGGSQNQGWGGSSFNVSEEEYQRGGKIFVFDLTTGNLITDIEHPNNQSYGNRNSTSFGAGFLGKNFAFNGDVVVAGRGNTKDIDIYSATDGSIISTLVDAMPFTSQMGYRPPAVAIQDEYIVVFYKDGTDYYSGGRPTIKVYKA